MAELRLVHISDLHCAFDANRLPSPFQQQALQAKVGGLLDIAVRRGERTDGFSDNVLHCASHSTRAARHFASFLKLRLQPNFKPHIFVVSGDLSTSGEFRDLKCARDYLTSPCHAGWTTRLGAPSLDIQGGLVVLPGNHDRYRGKLLRSNGKEFDEAFKDLWNPLSSCGRVSTCAHRTTGGMTVVVGCADFSLLRCRDGWPPAWVGHVGTGRAYSHVVKNLVEASRAACFEYETQALIWVVHFPPGFQGVSPSLKLHQEGELIAAAQESGVALLLAGHTHDARRYRLGGVVVNCAKSLLEASEHDDWGFSACKVELERGAIRRMAFYDYAFDSHHQWFERVRSESIAI